MFQNIATLVQAWGEKKRNHARSRSAATDENVKRARMLLENKAKKSTYASLTYVIASLVMN